MRVGPRSANGCDSNFAGSSSSVRRMNCNNLFQRTVHRQQKTTLAAAACAVQLGAVPLGVGAQSGTLNECLLVAGPAESFAISAEQPKVSASYATEN